MAQLLTSDENNIFINSHAFPPVSDGRVNIMKFIQATTDLVKIVERLGAAFAPVKYDMQGNIEKIQNNFKFNENSCLLELILEEKASGKTVGTESVLWLNRTLLFFELTFVEILSHLKENDMDVSMKNIFTIAYEGSVKNYHNWVTQQLFKFISKMSPSLPQILKYFGGNQNILKFQIDMENYNKTLRLVRSTVENFFCDNNLLKQFEKIEDI